MTERNRALDALRGMAILWVMGYHLFGRAPLNPLIEAVPGLAGVLGFGWLGVVGFFVLSGYLITGNLVAERENATYWRRFLVKRTARILPAYGLLLVSMPIAAWLWGGSSHSTVFNSTIPSWSHFLLIQNVFMASTGYLGNEWLRVTWSLAVEVQYYVLIAGLVWVCPLKRLPFLLAILALVAVGVRYALFLGLSQSSAPMMVLTLARMDSFALGGLLALLPIGKWSTARRWSLWGLGMAAAVVFLVYAKGGFGGATYGLVPTYYFLVSLAFAVLVVYAALNDGRIGKWVGVSPLVEAGRLSYFMYLFHMPIAWIIYDGLFNEVPESHSWVGLGRGIAVVGLTWVAAKASQRWFETPAITWGQRWLATQPKPAKTGNERQD